MQPSGDTAKRCTEAPQSREPSSSCKCGHSPARDPVQPPGWPPLHLRPHRTQDRTGGKTRASAPKQSEHSFRVAHLQVLQSPALDHMATCLSLVWDKWTNVIPNSLGAVGH